MLPLHTETATRRPARLLGLLLLANSVVFAIELLQPSPAATARLVETWGLIPAELWRQAAPERWATVFTAMFLHAGPVHLLGNLWFLWLFGRGVEGRLGSIRFCLLYFLSGIGAAAWQVAVDPFATTVMIGASGAISGVLAASLRHFPGQPVLTLTPLWFAPLLPVPAFVFIILWFAFQLWQGIGTIGATELQGGVAWWAHVGGFVSGWIVSGRLRPAARRR